MSSISSSVLNNLSSISNSLQSLSPTPTQQQQQQSFSSQPSSKLYSLAARVKYLVDSPENIWGRLDDSMLLEAAGRYLRARHVHSIIISRPESVNRFPLLHHQWQIVETFKPQIYQKTRDRLFSDRNLQVSAYADAIAAAAIIDNLSPRQSLSLFLDSRHNWVSCRLLASSVEENSFATVLGDIARIVRTTLGQVGELFFPALSERPLFYKTVLGTPPGTQLFGGIPDPEEEVKLWKLWHEKLESAMVELEPEYIARTCSEWLRRCCNEVFGALPGQRRLVDSFSSGEGLVTAERLVRDILDGRDGLEGSLEQWLKSVFGLEIESPWNQIRGLILKDGEDILEDRLEANFLMRMKEIVDSGFDNLKGEINIKDLIEAIVAGPDGSNDFQAYLKKRSLGGGLWFSDPSLKKTGPLYSLKQMIDENDIRSCLSSYLGPEVSRIRDVVDSKCRSILEDLLSFVESYNSTSRLKELAPYIQDKCYNTISSILKELEDVLEGLQQSLQSKKEETNAQPAPVIVERALFLGRLLYALRNHSDQIPLILSSPRQWAKDANITMFAQSSLSSRQVKGSLNSPISISPRRPTFDSPRSPGRQNVDTPRRQTIQAAAKLFQAENNTNQRFYELNKTLQEFCIRAHNLWIQWVSDELSIILLNELRRDDRLLSSIPLWGWEVTEIKQESTDETAEMQVHLPSMPSLYVTSFLYQACVEIHKVGGHVLDRIILQNFAWTLLQKVVSIYENSFSTAEAGQPRISDKGVLQVLLDLRFTADVLSGGKSYTASDNSETTVKDPSKISMLKSSLRKRSSDVQAASYSPEAVMRLIHQLSQRLDPIDWATYEPYLWENEKQSYKRHSILFGFFVQLNGLYTGTVQKLPTKSKTDYNILNCSTVPRFKYLPISAPALSSRGPQKSALQTSGGEASSRNPWNAYSNGEQSPKPDFDDSMGFGVATPLLKSFMTQVGSKFGEGTSRLGWSMLADGQVSKLKDRSAAAMSTFGDILPVPAAGFLSSLTSGAPRLDT